MEKARPSVALAELEVARDGKPTGRIKITIQRPPAEFVSAIYLTVSESMAVREALSQILARLEDLGRQRATEEHGEEPAE